MLMRVAAFCVLIGMPDPGARRAREMFRTIGIEAYNTMAQRLFYNWRNYFRSWRGRNRS